VVLKFIGGIMEFLEIFTHMHYIPAMLLIIGVVLMLVEMFIPGFGLFGITGVLSLIIGVIIRICDGLNVTQSLTLILIVLGVLVLILMLMVYGAQHGILGKTGLFERRSTLETNYNQPEREIKRLVGKSGKAITNLDMAGKAKIRGEIYDVVSISSFIEQGANIKVVEIKDNAIMVRKWFE
jgi:membrane-bound serine protease (ClpP class)